MRTRFRFKWILYLVIALVLAFPVWGAETPATFGLTIIHANDFHGYEPTDLARQMTLIKQIKAQVPNVLVLNAGDVFTRGKYQEVFYGEMEFAELNVMGLDALTLGNNEFKATKERDTAQKYLFARLDQARFPLLCANVRMPNGAYLPHVQPYIVKTIAGVRIGILGISTTEIATQKQSKDFIMDDPITTAGKLYPTVAAASDVVVALTHIGFDEDKLLANAVPGLAAIVGGHSHTVLQKPFTVGGVPIVQAGGEDKRFLGRLDLTFVKVNNVWKLKQYKGVLLPINNSIPEDPAVKAILNSYLAKVQKPAA